MTACNDVEFVRDVTVAEIWEALLPRFLEVFGKTTVKLREKKIKPETLPEALRKAKADSAWVGAHTSGRDLADYDFDLDTDKKCDLLALDMRRRVDQPIEWWDQWMEVLPAESVIFGCAYDSHYLSSQIAWNLECLAQIGVDVSSRPKVFDADLQEEIVDISKNPGLRIKRTNHFEMVGAVMWIGPRFVERTGGSWEPLKKQSWCRIAETKNGLVRLQSFERHFDSDQGEQAKRQRVLREVLFPNGAPVDPMGVDPAVPY